MCINNKEGDPGKLDRIATLEMLKGKEKGIVVMSPQQEDIINKPEPKLRFRIFWVQEVLLLGSHEEISVGGGHPGTHGCALNLKAMEGVEEEVVVGKDKVGEGYEEIRGRVGGRRAFR